MSQRVQRRRQKGAIRPGIAACTVWHVRSTRGSRDILLLSKPQFEGNELRPELAIKINNRMNMIASFKFQFRRGVQVVTRVERRQAISTVRK
jgi:hypothetical protein